MSAKILLSLSFCVFTEHVKDFWFTGLGLTKNVFIEIALSVTLLCEMCIR